MKCNSLKAIKFGNRSLLAWAIACALSGVISVGSAHAAKAKSPHKFKGNVELQFQTNDNIGLAASSSGGIGFASFADFAEAAEDDGEGEEGDEDEDSDDFEDFDEDVEGSEFDEDELDEDDAAFDEDGDGIDDLLDGDADSVIDAENRITTKFGLGHKFSFAGSENSWGSSFKAVGDFHNDRDDLDKGNFTVGTGPEFVLKDQGLKIKPALSYVVLRQNGTEFLSTFVATLGLSYEATKDLELKFNYNYQDKDVTKPESPDAIINTLTIGAEYAATKKDIFKLEYSPKVEDSSITTKNKDVSGWEVSYSRKLPWDMIGGAGFKSDSVDFKNLTPNRKDDTTVFELLLEKKFSKTFNMSLGYENRERDSNIPGKDADNSAYSISAAWSF